MRARAWARATLRFDFDADSESEYSEAGPAVVRPLIEAAFLCFTFEKEKDNEHTETSSTDYS
jgi:hypothetical protein